jgi:hypothetical protein
MTTFTLYPELLPEMRRRVCQLAPDADARSLGRTCHEEWKHRDRARVYVQSTVNGVRQCSDFGPLYHDMDICWTKWDHLLTVPFRMWVYPPGNMGDPLYIVTRITGGIFDWIVTIAAVTNPWNLDKLELGQEDVLMLKFCIFVREGSPYWHELVDLARSRHS